MVNINVWFIYTVGVCIFIFSLVCLILLYVLLRKVLQWMSIRALEQATSVISAEPRPGLETPEKSGLATATFAPVPAANITDESPDRRKIVAAVAVSIAEYLGTDVSGIRILSFKQLR